MDDGGCKARDRSARNRGATLDLVRGGANATHGKACNLDAVNRRAHLRLRDGPSKPRATMVAEWAVGTARQAVGQRGSGQIVARIIGRSVSVPDAEPWPRLESTRQD